MNSRQFGNLSTANAKAQVALQTLGAQNLTGNLKTLQNHTLHGLYGLLSEITGVQRKIQIFAKNRKQQLTQTAAQDSKATLDRSNRLVGQIGAEATSLKAQIQVLSDGITDQLDFLQPNARENRSASPLFYRALAELDTQLSLLQNELKFVLGNFDNILRDSAPQNSEETSHLFAAALLKELKGLAKEVA